MEVTAGLMTDIARILTNNKIFHIIVLYKQGNTVSINLLFLPLKERHFDP